MSPDPLADAEGEVGAVQLAQWSLKKSPVSVLVATPPVKGNRPFTSAETRVPFTLTFAKGRGTTRSASSARFGRTPPRTTARACRGSAVQAAAGAAAGGAAAAGAAT